MTESEQKRNMPDDNAQTDVWSNSETIVDNDDPTITVSGLTLEPDSAVSAPTAVIPDDSTTSMPELTAEEPLTAPRLAAEKEDESTLSVSTLDATDDDASPATEPKEGGSKVGFTLEGRYQLKKVLGRGGFGEVYLADDLTLKRRCVIKRMLVKRRSSAQLEIHRANFRREAELLARLNDPGHDNIPEIYDYFFDDDGNYLVMKYIEGQDLKQLLAERHGALADKDIARYARDLCSALHYMHTYYEQPVLHRDIKPSNILLGNDGRIWLVDFGLAKAIAVEEEGLNDHADVTKASGTIGYTPFEQWLGEPVEASDIYALGATLHQLLTNVDPKKAYQQREFNVQTLQQLQGQFTPIRAVNPEVDRELAALVESAVSADWEQRPTAWQLYQQLTFLTSGVKDAPLFTFKHGQAAKTKGALVDLCDRYRPEARVYLHRGDFERWFRLINRHDLANAAAKAVKQSKPAEGRRQKVVRSILTPYLFPEQDGLERFLKLIFPNLFLRRLGRAALNMAQLAFLALLIAISIMIPLLYFGSIIAGWGLKQWVATHEWNYYSLSLEQPNAYSEQDLDEFVTAQTASFFNDVLVDVHPTNQVDLTATLAGFFRLEWPLEVELADQKPHFQLRNGSFPLNILSNNLLEGLNGGIAEAFAKAPIDLTELDTTETEVSFVVERSRRAPWQPPAGLPQPAPAPATAAHVLLGVFNQSGYEITLEIAAQSYVIAVDDSKALYLSPGEYNYVIKAGGIVEENILELTEKANRLVIQ